MGLYKRGQKWWVAFSLDRKMVYRPTPFRDKKLAAAWAEEYKTECRKGIVDPFTPKGPVPTLSEVLAKYFEVHLKGKNARSYGESDQYRKGPIVKYMGGNTPITRIRPRLDIFRAKRVLEDKVSIATVKRELAYVRAAVRKAIEWQWISQDPMSGYRLPKVDNRRDRYIEDAEFERLLNAAHPAIVPVLIMARHTGMRQGELLNLQWPDVDLRRGWLFIRHSKSGETRNVPLTSEIVMVLSATPLSERDGFVFKHQRNPLNRGGFIKYRFLQAVKVAGLANFRFHHLRHRADSPVMPTVSKEIRLPSVWRGVPCLADRRKSA